MNHEAPTFYGILISGTRTFMRWESGDLCGSYDPFAARYLMEGMRREGQTLEVKPVRELYEPGDEAAAFTEEQWKNVKPATKLCFKCGNLFIGNVICSKDGLCETE